MNENADSKHGLEELNQFTRGPWIWNKQQQFACRFVKFGLSVFLQLASSAIGSKSCTQVLKISEGQYIEVFQITMDNGREIIAKLPNPNAGRPHFTTASEVATMDFSRNTLNLPVPLVYAWSSRASEIFLGAEYIIMEKQAGVGLTDVWDSLKWKQKVHVLGQIVDIQRRLAGARFAKFGSLYYGDDIPDNAYSNSSLYLDSAGNKRRSKRFCIGTLTTALSLALEEVQQREEDGDLWAQGVALMDTLISDTGFFKHWDGIVDEIDYERSRKELGRGVVRFLEREARNDDERREWLNALKFVD
ncbi:hypothetical protein CBS11852_1934 [Aspergillus niger]|nr:hypothetical protein CBS11852_1934 [Aspergillus niger]